MKDPAILLIGAALWWLMLSAVTASVISESRQRQGRPLAAADVCAIIASPLVWLLILVDAARASLTRHRQATRQ